jgi:hypothetical protein
VPKDCEVAEKAGGDELVVTGLEVAGARLAEVVTLK